MPALLLLAALFSGTAALVAEVVWFRGLGRGVGTSAEALAVVSAAFLGGLGLGAAIASRRIGRVSRPLRAAAACEALAGILVFLSPVAIAWVPDGHVALLRLLGLEPGRSAWPAALVAVPLLVLPTAFLGATLPLLVRALVADGVARAGRFTGLLYGANTLGAVVGTCLAAAYLLPGFGEIASLRIAGGLNVLAAAWILLAESPAEAGAEASLVPPSAIASAAPLPSPALLPSTTPCPSTTPSPSPSPLPVPHPPSLPLAPVGSPSGRGRVSTLELALFASGAFALGAEVAWFRLLEPLTGVHIYGFALLLASVLVGTAIGGAIGGFVADRARRPDLALANVIAIGGALVVGSVWLAGAVPFLALRAATEAADAARTAGAAAADVSRAAHDALWSTKLWACALCAGPALVPFGMAYPIAVRARATDPTRAAAAVGSTYAWNTAGNVLGSLAAGFLLLPAIGGPKTLAVLGGLALATGAAVRLGAGRPRRALVALAPLAALALLALPGAGAAIDAAGPRLPEIVSFERWESSFAIRSREDLAVFAESAAGTYPRPAGRPDLPPVLPREGTVSGVGLLQEKSVVRVRQGGLSESKIVPSRPDAGSDTEVALALVPYLAHPDPKRALCIGHGAGWSAETLLATPMDVDVAELESALLDAVEEYRGGPLAVRTAENAHLFLADGRVLLRRAAERPVGARYDVIVSQPSHPWVPGAGHLFTQEAYALARSALNPGGVFAQWLNVFSTSRPLLRTALEAWRRTFPDSWVLVYADELVLVGFTAPGTIDVPRWRRELAHGLVGVRARAAGISDPADLVSHLMIDGDGLARLLPPRTPPATDDDARLETGLAWLRFRPLDWDAAKRQKESINEDLRAVFPPGLTRIVPDAGERDRLLAEVVLRLFDAGTDAGNREARRRLAEPSLAFDGGATGRRARAKEALLDVNVAGFDAETRRERATRGIELLRSAVALAPDDPESTLALGEALLARGRTADAEEALADAAARMPDDGRILALLAHSIARNGEHGRAAAAFVRALAARRPPAPAGTGFAYARILLAAEPRRPLEARDALRADPGTPDDEDALQQLRELEIEIGSPQIGGSAGREDVEARIAEERARRGRVRLAAAITGIVSQNPDPSAADEAADLLPDEPLAWRARGWYALRASSPDKAAESFRRAIEVAEDPAAERRWILAWYRILRRTAPTFERPAP